MFKKIILCFIVLFSSWFFSCTTTNTAEITDIIAANTRANNTIKNTVYNLDTIIKGSTERINTITEQSEEITDGINRLGFMFSEYESEVNRLLTEINNLRNEIKE